MCFGAFGDAVGAGVRGIDQFANNLNPMKDPMKDLTDATVGKVYRPAGQLYDYSNSHPLESYAAASAIAAAWSGAGAALGGVGEGGAGAGAEAGAGAGAEAGAGSAAADSGSVNLFADAVPGAGGDVGASAGGGGAGTAGSSWVDYGKTAAKVLGPTLLSAALQPKPPKTKAPTAMPDPLAEEQAQRQKIIDQMSRRGRASTILTSATNGSLGG